MKAASAAKSNTMKQRLDIYDRLPSGMREYLSAYGWHFSKKMAEWAVSMMEGRNGENIKMKEMEILTRDMKMNGISLTDSAGYDAAYVEAMARADYFGSSITDDAHLYRFVKDYLEDADGYDGIAFTRFHADCIAKGMPIMWEEML